LIPSTAGRITAEKGVPFHFLRWQEMKAVVKLCSSLVSRLAFGFSVIIESLSLSCHKIEGMGSRRWDQSDSEDGGADYIRHTEHHVEFGF
jgi:hypothetical protein